MFRAKYLILVLVLALPSLVTLEVDAQAAPAVAKLAKDFNVSPNLLAKFSKAGLSRADLGDGLKIAKEVANVKNLKMDDAAEQVLGLKQRGQEWPAIAKEFGVELPTGVSIPSPK